MELLLDPGNQNDIDYDALNNTEKELVIETRTVLKNEWIRVRKGEMIYRITCLSLLVMVGIVLSMLFIGLVCYLKMGN